MKTQHLFILIALVALSCQKDEVADIVTDTNDQTEMYPISIRAGQETGVGIHHVDYSPDLAFNVNPTVSMLSDSIELDLNADSTPDFILTYYHSSVYQLGSTDIFLRIRPLAENQVCVSPTNNTWADSLRYNAVIDSSRTWSDQSATLYYDYSSQNGSSGTYGYFMNNSQYYIGVKINSNGHVFYGWIYMNREAIDKYSITTEYFE